MARQCRLHLNKRREDSKWAVRRLEDRCKGVVGGVGKDPGERLVAAVAECVDIELEEPYELEVSWKVLEHEEDRRQAEAEEHENTGVEAA